MSTQRDDWRDYSARSLAGDSDIASPQRVSGPYDWTGFSPTPDDAVWPSELWAHHLTVCAVELHGGRCSHPISVPEWWRAIVSRGDASHPQASEALRQAAAFIRGFRGHPVLAPDVCTFARLATLDGLCMAPAPVTATWVRLTLAPVAGLARWADLTGRPLTRAAVFSEETIRLWLQGGQFSERTSAVYFSRLWLLGGLFSGLPQAHLPRTHGTTRHRLTEPHKPSEVAALWRWTTGLSRAELRHRVRACLLLGLGCGLRSAEMTALCRSDVSISGDGVEVAVVDRARGERRIVTCLADWEGPLVSLLAAVPTTRPVVTPWNTTPPHEKRNAAVIANAQLRSCPVPFTSRSLRNTWILRHLAIGTPIDILLAGAGIEDARRLTPLIRMLSKVDADVAQQALRGTSAPVTVRAGSVEAAR